MRKLVTIVSAAIIVLSVSNALGGQTTLLDGTLNGYFGDSTSPRLFTFDSTPEAEDVVARIVAVTGLRPNFDVLASNEVPNAVAAVQRGRRLLIYNPGFITQLGQATGSEWAGISVMAHEVGHHLQGHTITARGSHPAIELEADEFSGFVLYRLGAALSEAQAAIRTSPLGSGGGTHPPRKARLEAIARGWRNAESFGPVPGREPAPSPWPDPRPNPWPNPNPNPWPNPQPLNNVCVTPYGACQLYTLPVPVGMPCYCVNAWGQIVNGSIQ